MRLPCGCQWLPLCLCVLSPLTIGHVGCTANVFGPRQTSFSFRDERSHQRVEPVIVVTLVSSTGWYPAIMMESRPWPQDKLRIESIKELDTGHNIELPRYTPSAGSYFGWVINEAPGFIIFASGYVPSVHFVTNEGKTPPSLSGVRLSAKGVDISGDFWKDAYRAGTSIEVTLDRNYKDASSLLVVLDEDALWELLKKEYYSGRERALIAGICYDVCESANEFLRQNPEWQFNQKQQDNLHLCESLRRR